MDATEAATVAEEFFDTYTRHLLDRDAAALADAYAVPALIEFPRQRILVTDTAQTEQFFAGAFGQYEGIRDASTTITVPAATDHSIWVVVEFEYDGPDDVIPGERNMYQLVRVDGGWKIGVLTPLG